MFHFRKRRIIALVGIMMSVIISALPAIHSSADSTATDTSKPKIINVVYDDSRSMFEDGSTRWSQAKYALEVFTAMMGENDTLNIYNMSEYWTDDPSATINPKITKVKGSNNNRVSDVHNMNSEYSATPVESIYGAAEALQKESDNNEKWLVVLTDGVTFYQNKKELTPEATTSLLTECLNDYASNLKVVYLAIGENPTKLKSSSGNFHSYIARDSGNEILSRVTDIANLIFEYQKLPSNVISNSGSDYKLSIDIPTKQIIAFAQGESVSVSSMSLNGKSIDGKTMTVKYSDVKPKDFYKKGDKTVYEAVTDESLKGAVAQYNSGNNPYEDGTFDINISGASSENVVFYYKPGVEASCQFLDEDGKPADSRSGIETGEYTIKVTFINPLTGDAVSSDLLKINSSSVSVVNNGNSIPAADGSKVTLEEGTTELKTVIELEGNIIIESSRTYEVKPEAVNILLDIKTPDFVFKANELGETAKEHPIVVTVIDQKTGLPISKEAWDECKAKVSGSKDDKYIEWEIEKGTDVGTFIITPYAKNDKIVTKIEEGSYSFEVSVSTKINKQKAEAEGSGAIQIASYSGTMLVFEQEEVPNPIRVHLLPDFEGIKVNAYMVDIDSGEKTLITEDVWNCLNVKAVQPKTKRITWKVEKGSKPGTYIVKPGWYAGKLELFTYGAVNGRVKVEPPVQAPDGIMIETASNISTTLEGFGTDGPLVYSGTGTAGMQVSPLTAAEIWKLIRIYVIVAAIILFLWIGYTKKSWISRKQMGPHVSYKGMNNPCKYSISFITTIMPYVDERAIIFNFKPAMGVDIPALRIVASKGNTFRILNADQILKKGLVINGAKRKPTDGERVANTVYGYSGFTMKNAGAMGTQVGQFFMGKARNEKRGNRKGGRR